MTRRKMLWAGSVALLVAVAGVGTMSWRSNNAEPQLDCQIVRELIEYNSAKGKQMAAGFNPQAGTEASLEDYRALADRLAGYSSQLRDAGLAEDTQALADDTDRLAGLIDKARSGGFGPEDPLAPPPWEQRYVDLSKDFNRHLHALDAACPVS